MFAKFKIEKSLIERYTSNKTNLEVWDAKQTQVRDILDKFIKGVDGVIKGTELQKYFFPTEMKETYHVFISHSHKDECIARRLAAFLKEKFNINCFIDSLVWGNIETLLKNIDNKYCLNDDKKYYSYSKRNQTTAHVHAMLSLSLLEMLQKTECCILIGDGENIDLKDVAKGGTLSPWIYEEITYMNNLPIVPLRNYTKRKEFSEKGNINEATEFNVRYTPNVSKFIKLNETFFSESNNRETAWLDEIYTRYGIIETQTTVPTFRPKLMLF